MRVEFGINENISENVERRIIEDAKSDENTVEDYAKTVMVVIAGSEDFEIYKAKAFVTENSKVKDYYFPGSKNADIWIEFLAYNHYEGAYECGAYLSDIWNISEDEEYNQKLKERMYVLAFTQRKNLSEGERPMDYLYKITVWVDDEKILNMKEDDLNGVYRVIRETFAECNFKEQPTDDGTLVFTIGDGKDSFSEVGLATTTLRTSWLGKYLKRMEWYDSSDDSTEDMFKELEEYRRQRGK